MMARPLPEIRTPSFVRSAIAGLLAGAGVLPWPCSAQASPEAARSEMAVPLVALPALPPGSRYTPLGVAMHIQGLPLQAYVFDAPVSPPDLAAWLTAQQPALRDMWVVRGAVILAGIVDGLHWVVRFADGGAGHTQGTISALPADGRAEPASMDSSDAASWRLPGGQLHFETRSRDDDAVVVQQVWTHVAAPAALRQRLARDLAREGWTSAEGGVERSAQRGAPRAARWVARRWSRGRSTLLVTIVPLDQGSGITAVIRIGA